MVPQTAAFICSTSHSGSTLLDLCLGTQPYVVGLGEIYGLARKWVPALREGAPLLCSCWRPVDACPIWSRVRADLLKAPTDLTAPDVYRLVVDEFRNAFGPATLLVDSSKRVDALEILSTTLDGPVSVIFLVRDMRGWITARRERRKPQGRRWSAVPPVFPRSSIRLGLSWYRFNRALQSHLDDGTRRVLLVSYEELCFRPRETLGTICEWLGLAPPSNAVDLMQSNSHILTGNKMRISREQRTTITYDSRWLDSAAWLPPYLLPPLRRLNTELVWARPSRRQ